MVASSEQPPRPRSLVPAKSHQTFGVSVTGASPCFSRQSRLGAYPKSKRECESLVSMT